MLLLVTSSKNLPEEGLPEYDSPISAHSCACLCENYHLSEE